MPFLASVTFCACAVASPLNDSPENLPSLNMPAAMPLASRRASCVLPEPLMPVRSMNGLVTSDVTRAWMTPRLSRIIFGFPYEVLKYLRI